MVDVHRSIHDYESLTMKTIIILDIITKKDREQFDNPGDVTPESIQFYDTKTMISEKIYVFSHKNMNFSLVFDHNILKICLIKIF